MAGKVTPLEGVIPKPALREVVSYELSPLWSSGERYNPDDLVGRRGLRIYNAMLVDEQVKAVCQFKRDAITSRGWTFAYEDDTPLSEDEQASRIAVLANAVRVMRGSFEDALNAIARGRHHGYALVEKVYDVFTFNGAQWVGINQLLARDPATFVFYTDAYGTLERTIQKVSGAEIDVDLSKFIHYVHAPEEDRYHGQSDLRQAYRAWYAKDQLVKLYLTYLERFAGGFAVMAMKEGAGVTQGSPEYVAMQTVLRNLRTAAGLIVPPGVDFKLEMPAASGEYREALTYFDLAIAKALLVPNLLGLSHAGQTGSYSQSQTQLEAFFWTLNADTRRLEACLNEQLFRELGDMNWGDGAYPTFRFNPASQDHVKWVVSTWKDLVGVKAVQATEADEAHLRELLDMPARTEEAEDADAALKSDPAAAFTGVQITAMLDVLTRVAEGTLPKASAALVLMQSFPISREDADAILAPIVEGSAKPEPAPGSAPRAGDGDASSGGDGADGQPPSQEAGPTFRVQAHTEDGHPRLVTMSTFLRAAQRVDFAVLEKRHAALSDATVEELSRLMARATWRILGDEAKMRELLDADTADIEFVKVDAADVGKIKAACKAGLSRGWSVGAESAQREMAKAKADQGNPAVFRDVRTLRAAAADFFEANGFRMAANMTDAARSIIQQELLQAVKGAKDVRETAATIYARLVKRGLVRLKDVDAETGSTALLDNIAATLGGGVETANVAHYLETLVRTNTFEALNEARFAAFQDPALEGFVQGFEYSAILDDRTTDICEALNGLQLPADSPEWDKYRPPNHYNCRSVLVPITLVDGWDGKGDDIPARNGEKVQPAEGFG